MNNAVEKPTTTIVVVTYNRTALLSKCLDSILRLDPAPAKIVVVDNASTDNTLELMASYQQKFGDRLIYKRLAENTGGSGGFSAGMDVAYHETDSDWFWLMDDDVEVIPDALTSLSRWAKDYKHIQGRRYDFDGSAFYWQYKQSIALGIPIPFAPADFGDKGFQPMNSGCFEGMYIHRSVVQKIGLPDPRFFIYWDDALYGWLASRITPSIAVKDFVLKRTRQIKQLDMGIRHLNASSDMYRYYILRNRGYLKQYFAKYGAHRRIRFALGTALTFAKEYIRLFLVERKFRGSRNLWRGWRDARKIMRDKSWQAMPALEEK